jgi:hypothetical protein
MSLLGRITKREWAGSVGVLLWAWLLFWREHLPRSRIARHQRTSKPRHRTLYIWTPAVIAASILLLALHISTADVTLLRTRR